MSVVTSLEETGPWRKKVTIEVPIEAVEAEAARSPREQQEQEPMCAIELKLLLLLWRRGYEVSLFLVYTSPT